MSFTPRLLTVALALTPGLSVAAASGMDPLQAAQVAAGASGAMPADIASLMAAQPAPASRQTLRQPAKPAARPGVSGMPDATAEPLEAPARKPTAYEREVSQRAGEPLRLFGLDFFSRSQGSASDLPMADDYLLGPGDVVNVRLWGQVDADLTLEVDRNGNLYLPKVGNVAVNGLRFSQLQGVLRAAVGRLYRNFDLAVASGDLKTLSITVVGLVEKPGVYALSSQGTVFNALAAAGGPNEQGSLRQVRLKRRDGRTEVLDLYALLFSGDKVADFRLQAGDVISVPRAGLRVAVSGGVTRPGIYEAVKGASLQEAVTLAAGLSRDADTQYLTLDRLVPGQGRLAEALSADRLAGLAVQDGDLLRVGKAPAAYQQSVSLRGHVAFPRQVQWRDGLRLSDLIDSPALLRPAAFWQRLNTSSATTTDPDVQATARREDPLTRLRDREDINWDYATIERLDPNTLGTELLSFNLRRAVIDKLDGDNLVLKPGDVVTLYSNRDIAVPKDKRPRYVRVTGEVAEPGVYRLQPGETLPALIARIGGLTPSAYLFGMQFSREDVRARQAEALKRFVAQQEKLLTQSVSAQAAAALGAEEVARIKAQTEAQREALNKLKEQQPSGRVVLGLSTRVNDLDDLPELALEDGDSIVIPALPSTVGVQGEVFSAGDFLTQSSRVGYFLDRAGGATDNGELGEAFLLRADGSVVARKQQAWLFGLVNTFGFTRAMPGDTVIVPAKLERTPFLRNLRDVSQVLANFGLGAAAINNLKN